MSEDARTDAQKSADETLDAAVRKVVAAYWGEGYVTEFVVVAHQLLADAHGEQDKVVLALPGGGRNMPVYRVLGLMAAGRLFAEQQFAEGEPLDP